MTSANFREEGVNFIQCVYSSLSHVTAFLHLWLCVINFDPFPFEKLVTTFMDGPTAQFSENVKKNPCI